MLNGGHYRGLKRKRGNLKSGERWEKRGGESARFLIAKRKIVSEIENNCRAPLFASLFFKEQPGKKEDSILGKRRRNPILATADRSAEFEEPWRE